MSRRFQYDVYRNRLDVFRHTFRNLALASAAASGLALGGCANSHGAGADAGANGDQQVMTPDMRVLGRWDPTCVDTTTIVDLTGVTMPAGVDAYAVYMETPWWSWQERLRAGDLCGSMSETDCTMTVNTLLGGQSPPGSFTGPPLVIVRRGAALSVGSLSEVRPTTPDSARAAALFALDEQYVVTCAQEFGVGPSYVEEVSDGYVVHGMRNDCSVYSGSVHVETNGDTSVMTEMLVQQDVCAVIGRLTDGCDAPQRPAEGGELGRYFAQVAGLEAAAVDAFERLAAELAELGAPEELVAWARQGADEEREHTERMAALATRYGATPTRPKTAGATFPTRSLFDFALENAVEGCVRETYGAVVGHHQAARAADPAVREAMQQVAEDETGHAALSWAIADWAAGHLSAGERELISAAQRRAIATLRQDVAQAEPEPLLHDAGLPSPEVAAAILDGLSAGVWAA